MAFTVEASDVLNTAAGIGVGLFARPPESYLGTQRRSPPALSI